MVRRVNTHPHPQKIRIPLYDSRTPRLSAAALPAFFLMNHPYFMVILEFLHDLPGVILRAVIYKDQFQPAVAHTARIDMMQFSITISSL